jgi:hypothetical protein
MTGIFEDRERGYEANWAHEEEVHFKTLARRNNWLGEWAAGLMHLPEAEAVKYTEAVIQAGLSGKGAQAVFEKLRADLAARNISCSDAAIRAKMQELLTKAEAEAKK